MEEDLSLILPRVLASWLNSTLAPPNLELAKRMAVVPGPTRRLDTLLLQPRSSKAGLLSLNFQQVPPNFSSLKLHEKH